MVRSDFKLKGSIPLCFHNCPLPERVLLVARVLEACIKWTILASACCGAQALPLDSTVQFNLYQKKKMLPSGNNLPATSPIPPSDGPPYMGTVPELMVQSLSDDTTIPVAVVQQSGSEVDPDEELLNWKRPPLEVSIFLPDMMVECAHDNLEAFLIQETPRMVYIKGFLSEAERNHLMEIRYVFLSW